MVGAILIIAGIVVWLWGNKLTWLGNLPGDIRIKKENFSVYIPITTMILVSLFLTFILWIIRRFLH